MVVSESSWAIFRRLGLQLYVPFVFAGLGRGMLLPTIPLYFRDRGLTYQQIAVILAAVGVGAIAGGVPSGWAAGRFGSYRLFILATVVVSVSAALVGVTAVVGALLMFRLVFGIGQNGLQVALQSLVRDATVARSRGRAMAMAGGMRRVSVFVGPLVGGVLADQIGYRATFVVSGAVSALGLIPFIWARPASAAVRPTPVPHALRNTVKRHGSLLLLAGLGPALVTTVREGREVVVPLIGEQLALSASAVGVLVAIGTGIDLLLFPVAGWLSDRFGRLAAMVPAFVLLGLGMVVLGLYPTVVGIVVSVILMGIGNGLSAGSMMTLGADIAPDESGPFLAAFGMLAASGIVVAPLLVGWFASVFGLRFSAIALGVLMVAGLGLIVVTVGDTSRPSRPWLVRRLPDEVICRVNN